MTHRPPVGRMILLPIIAFLIALGIQAIMKAAGLSSENPLRVFATPLIAAIIVYWGLDPYPRAGRLRLAAMVGAGVLLVALAT